VVNSSLAEKVSIFDGGILFDEVENIAAMARALLRTSLYAQTEPDGQANGPQPTTGVARFRE
jgi:hypothetical protein